MNQEKFTRDSVALNWTHAQIMEYAAEWRASLDKQRAELERGEADYARTMAQYERERVDNYDGAPYCQYCGARREQDCHSGPIADNN